MLHVAIVMVNLNVKKYILSIVNENCVGKRTHDLMDTVNAKRDGRPFAGVSINN
jgi:hypothetical protein